MTFRAPVHVGELVTFRASVNFRKLRWNWRVEAESIRERTFRHVITCFHFTMVAVDEGSKPDAGCAMHARNVRRKAPLG